MNLQGRDLVSQATQRSARAMVATALAVLLAKIYAVPLGDLVVLEVSIPLAAVKGAVVAVLGFQIVNHLVHWWGDLSSIQAWNDRQQVNGIGRHGASSDILAKLDKALEDLHEMTETIKNRSADNYPDVLTDDAERAKAALEELVPSVKSFRIYGAFYFFGWYLVLPVGLAGLALFLPGLGT